MANPTKGWDKVPVYGWYFELDGVTPKVGTIELKLAQRVNSKDGRNIFPGGTIKATLGGNGIDTTVMNQVRSAMRAADQAAVEATGDTFDGAAWDADWDARVPAAVFTSFPASDDPDIVQSGFQVMVTEKLNGDPGGKVYAITPLLSDLDKPVPGVNLGNVDVPPGAPSAPAPIYQKGQPGGVAPLDDAGLVPTVNLPASIAGAGSWTTLSDMPAVIAAGDTQQDARAAIGAGTSDLTVGTTSTDAKAGDWKPAAADISDASAVGQALVKATDATVARTAIGAGTSSVVLGTTAGTAADASTVVPTTRKINAKPLTGDIALDASDVDARPVNWFPAAADISDASTVGKSLVKAVDAMTARDAIGAGTSNLVLGTVVGTAADASTVASKSDLAARFNNRGAWVNGGVYAVNDVVTSGGAYFYALIAHTAASPAPTVTTPTSYWAVLSTNVVIGTQAGQAADGAATAASLALKATKSLLPQFRFWDPGARTWTPADTTAPSRICISTNDTTAATPDSYGAEGTDLWWEATA